MAALDHDQQVALRVIDSIDHVLETKGNGASPARAELARIAKSIEGNGSMQGEQLLSEFLLANPELLAEAHRDTLQQVVDFITRVCAHYETVKAQRPLLAEEKQLGKRLLALVDAVAPENGS